MKQNEKNILEETHRRYPRVFLTGVMRQFPFLKNAEVVWPSGFASGIYDFGRSSATLYFPMRLNMTLHKDESIKLGFRFGKNAEIFHLDCRVIRSETRLLVVELPKLIADHREAVMDFFNEDVLSQNVHYIPQNYYAPEQTFSHWFHGPQDTNVYAWLKDRKLTRLTLELGRNIHEWNQTGFYLGPSRNTLSYPTEDYAYYTNVLTPLQPLGANSEESLKLRYFVSTLISTHPAIKEVSRQIGS